MYKLTRRSLVAGSAALAQVKLPKKIRVGLAGMEGHTGEILNPLKNLPDAELVSAADPDPKRMARLPPGVTRYADYRQMLERESLDVVGECGPNHQRASVILACAARKLHVVAEKPLAIERADLERVKQAVARSGIRLSMLLPMRFAAPYLALKRIVEAGEIGEVAQVHAQKSYKLGERAAWMLRRSTFGGAIPYIGIHMVDLMRWIGGREFTETMSYQAHIGFPGYGDMENSTGSLFRMDNGGVGLLHMDYLRPETAPTHGDDRIRLAGTKGIAEYQEYAGVTLVTGSQKPRAVTELPKGKPLFADFLDSVYNGREAMLSLADIYRVNEIVLGARESAEQHRLVRL